MKIFKRLLLVLVLLLSLVLVGCKKDETPDDNTDDPNINDDNNQDNNNNNQDDENKGYTLDSVKASVANVFEQYSTADHGHFKLTVTNGDDIAQSELIFNYYDGQDGVESLATIITNANGTMSCYITEEEAYINRYDKSKTIVSVTDDEGYEIIENYSFVKYAEYPAAVLCPSFLNACEITSQEENKVSLSLIMIQYDISEEEESEILSNVYYGILEKDEVTVDITFEAQAVKTIKITLKGETTSVISLEFVSVSENEIAIDFPDFSEYTK